MHARAHHSRATTLTAIHTNKSYCLSRTLFPLEPFRSGSLLVEFQHRIRLLWKVLFLAPLRRPYHMHWQCQNKGITPPSVAHTELLLLKRSSFLLASELNTGQITRCLPLFCTYHLTWTRELKLKLLIHGTINNSYHYHYDVVLVNE